LFMNLRRIGRGVATAFLAIVVAILFGGLLTLAWMTPW